MMDTRNTSVPPGSNGAGDRMPNGSASEDRQTKAWGSIIEVVLEILRTEGYDAVRIRDVAKRARVSMATIYRFFPTRDDLIIGALEHWIAESWFPALEDFPEVGSLAEGFNRLHELVFAPWVEHPKLLESYHIARMSSAGRRLDTSGLAAAKPVAEKLLVGIDPEYARDLFMILVQMVHGVIARFSVGEIEAEDILPILERTVDRLTSDNAALAAAVVPATQALRKTGV